MRVVFLDIDGVLNTPEYCDDFPKRRDEWLRRPGVNTLGGFAEDIACIDPSKVALLEDLVKRADANVVLSTSWAWDRSVSYIATMLHLQGLSEPQRIIGSTCMESLKINPMFAPPPGRVRLDRTGSILYWLSRVRVEHYVALDDWKLDLPGHFIWTSVDKGLQPEQVDEALRILGVL